MITRRQQLARRWLWATVPAAIALLAAAALLAWQLAFVQVGLARTDAGDDAGAAGAFEAAEAFPVVDRWVPAFDLGTAHYKMKHWDAAADSFEQSLALAPVGAQCRILLNWAWSLEAGADALAETDTSGAFARLTQAQLILATAPCDERASDADADQNSGLAKQASDTRDRLSEKSGQTQPDDSSEDSDQDESDPSEELSHREQQAAQQRQQAIDRKAGATPSDGEKTW